ncbi:hypothetical protein KM043_007027 [Ampulex compressa]|nr:hypothetical protein KM043_007027 [Ampulex compressa]
MVTMISDTCGYVLFLLLLLLVPYIESEGEIRLAQHVDGATRNKQPLFVILLLSWEVAREGLSLSVIFSKTNFGKNFGVGVPKDPREFRIPKDQGDLIYEVLRIQGYRWSRGNFQLGIPGTTALFGLAQRTRGFTQGYANVRDSSPTGRVVFSEISSPPTCPACKNPLGRQTLNSTVKKSTALLLAGATGPTHFPRCSYLFRVRQVEHESEDRIGQVGSPKEFAPLAREDFVIATMDDRLDEKLGIIFWERAIGKPLEAGQVSTSTRPGGTTCELPHGSLINA